jgi:hypothetical protein
MTRQGRSGAADLDDLFGRIPARPLLVRAPELRFVLEPGDRALVAPGDVVAAGVPIAERILDGALVEVGRLPGAQGQDDREAGAAGGSGWPFRLAGKRDGRSTGDRPLDGSGQPVDRRTRAFPGKSWLGGSERRGHRGRDSAAPPLSGTLLYEVNGRWRAVAGENRRVVESPVTGVVREARNAVGIMITASGTAMPGALAAGQPARGRLDVPRLPDGELWASALDVSRAGGIVVAGSRISAQAIGRARAMSIRGLVAASVGSAELRDLQASESRQRASLAPSPPFGLLILDGYQRRPIAGPILTLLTAAAGMEAAIVTDPPLLVFDGEPVAPAIPSDWVRVRGGPHAGREGRVVGASGPWQFRSGMTLEAAFVRLDGDDNATAVALADLERFTALEPSPS